MADKPQWEIHRSILIKHLCLTVDHQLLMVELMVSFLTMNLPSLNHGGWYPAIFNCIVWTWSWPGGLPIVDGPRTGSKAPVKAPTKVGCSWSCHKGWWSIPNVRWCKTFRVGTHRLEVSGDFLSESSITRQVIGFRHLLRPVVWSSSSSSLRNWFMSGQIVTPGWSQLLCFFALHSTNKLFCYPSCTHHHQPSINHEPPATIILNLTFPSVVGHHLQISWIINH